VRHEPEDGGIEGSFMNALLIIVYLNLTIKIPVSDIWAFQQLAASMVTDQEVEMICASKEIDA